MDDEQQFRHLIMKAKELIHSDSRPNELLKGIAYYKQAYEIHQSEKLKKRIQKLQAYLEQIAGSDDDEAEQEDGEAMAHVGEGFYVYKELYDKLYAYQREGILFFWKLWRTKKGGILGDDMGLGKTIQVCAFLAGMFDAGRIKSVLIIVPVAVLINWMNEFQKWAPGIDVYDFHDQSKKERERVLRRIQNKGGVCLTSYGIVVNNADILSGYNGREFLWDYVILDEGHKIKNPTTKSAKGVHLIPAKNRVVLSGTPLMNNLKELWALFDWTHAGQLLGSARTFSMEFEGPITRAREKDATAGEQRLGVEMSKNLRDIIAPYFLRRSKMDVIQQDMEKDGSAPHMPTMTRKNDLICWVYLSENQKRIYHDFIQTEEVRELLSSTRSPLTALTALKKICDHPRVMTNRQCEQLGLTVSDGIDLDRLDAMVAEDTAHFSVEHIPDELLIEESGKMVFLVTLLDNLKAEGHRCLVFSQSRKVLNIIQKVVQNRGHRICRLDGTIRQLVERQKIIDRFMHDKSFSLFLLTTQVGGVGLTLTAADRVVIFDPSWNPATDSQAVDRAFRIGQDKNVVVYRLVTCGSIEEKIYRRQIFKDSINRMTTGDTKNPFRYFTKQDLKELFELSDTRVSVTQQQLEKLQQGMRKTDTLLDSHIAFLYSLEMFGISDHDLMFEIRAQKEIEGEADVDDIHSELYVKNRALKARQTLNAESEANMELVKKLGKYPGPQDEDVAKLFKSISSSNKAAEGSSQPVRRNFPRPTPQFTLADGVSSSDQFSLDFQHLKQFEPVLSSTLREQCVEEKLEELVLGDTELFEPRSPTPPPQSPFVDCSEVQGEIEKVADCFILSANTSSEAAPVEVCQRSFVTQHQPLFDNMPSSPYAVVKESMVFSPLSSKPLVSMEVAEEGHDELFLANKLTLLENSPKTSFTASRKRRSSFFQQFGNSSGGKRLLNSEFCQTAESPVDSPIVGAKKMQRLIISSDEEEDASETQINLLQTNLTLEKRGILAHTQLTSAKTSEDGNSSAGSEAEKEEEEEEGRNTANACDDLTEEQPQSKNTEEDANSFSDGGLKADEQYNSKTYYIPSSTEFDCAMKKTRTFLQQQDYCQAYSECRKALEICPGHKEADKLSSKLFNLICNSKEDEEMNEDEDDSDGGKLEDNCNKEPDEGLLKKVTENGNKDLNEERKEEEEEEEEQNETTTKVVDCGEEEETESEGSGDEEILERLIIQGKMALKNRNFEDALGFFTEANEMCGGSDALQKYIERIRSHLETNRD